MAELPFLVVHGAWISTVLVGMCAVGGLGAVIWRRRRRDAKEMRALVAERNATVTAPVAGSTTTVRGTYHVKEGARWLTVDGARIDVLGEPRIERGSRVTWKSGMSDHTLSDGDEVIARGTMKRVAESDADPAASYRTISGAWSFEDVEMIATKPATRMAPVHPVGAFGWFGLWGLIGYIALRILGGRLVDTELEYDEPASITEITSTDRLVIASALPGYRKKALAKIDRMIDRHMLQGPTRDSLRVDMARLADGCGSAVRMMLEVDRYDEALAEARECGATSDQLEVLLRLGRYEEANALGRKGIGSDLDRAVVAIGAGAWKDAAAAVNEIAFDTRGGRAGVTNAQERAAGLDCLALLFEARAGDKAAAGKLDALASTHVDACTAIAAIASKDLARITHVAANVPEGSRISWELSKIAWSYGVPPKYDEDIFEAISEALGRLGTYDKAWLASFALANRPTHGTHAWMVVYHLQRGDFAAARNAARAAAELLPAGSDDANDIQGIDVAIQIREGTPIDLQRVVRDSSYVHPVIQRAIEVRQGTATEKWFMPAYQTRCETAVQQAIPKAVEGDGGPFAKVLRECLLHWSSSASFFVALIPRITKNRDELFAALRSFRNEWGSSLQMPFSFLADIAISRDIGRLSNDTARATKMQAIIERHAKAFADHDRVVALLLLHNL